jgi:hypothetical protein
MSRPDAMSTEELPYFIFNGCIAQRRYDNNALDIFVCVRPASQAASLPPGV